MFLNKTVLITGGLLLFEIYVITAYYENMS